MRALVGGGARSRVRTRAQLPYVPFKVPSPKPTPLHPTTSNSNVRATCARWGLRARAVQMPKCPKAHAQKRWGGASRTSAPATRRAFWRAPSVRSPPAVRERAQRRRGPDGGGRTGDWGVGGAGTHTTYSTCACTYAPREGTQLVLRFGQKPVRLFARGGVARFLMDLATGPAAAQARTIESRDDGGARCARARTRGPWGWGTRTERASASFAGLENTRVNRGRCCYVIEPAEYYDAAEVIFGIGTVLEVGPAASFEGGSQKGAKVSKSGVGPSDGMSFPPSVVMNDEVSRARGSASSC